jgi:hypothetical protein
VSEIERGQFADLTGIEYDEIAHAWVPSVFVAGLPSSPINLSSPVSSETCADHPSLCATLLISATSTARADIKGVLLGLK